MGKILSVGDLKSIDLKVDELNDHMLNVQLLNAMNPEMNDLVETLIGDWASCERMEAINITPLMRTEKEKLFGFM